MKGFDRPNAMICQALLTDRDGWLGTLGNLAANILKNDCKADTPFGHNVMLIGRVNGQY